MRLKATITATKIVSQEASQVVWYAHLFQNFPQFVVIHTVKGFGIINKAEIDVFLELPCFLHSSVYMSTSLNFFFIFKLYKLY